MVKRDAKILLLSDKEVEYQTLVDAGYKHVFWFKSLMRAYEYFKEREEQLKKFDLVLLGSSSLKKPENNKYRNLFYKAINGKEKIPSMIFSSFLYEELDELNFYISYPDIDESASKEFFLSILEDSIPGKLKDEMIEIPKVEEKDVVLPKKCEDVRVLFMGYASNNVFAENYFKGEGFKDYTFVEANNYSLADNVENFVNYDLVVVDRLYNGGLILLGDEFQDYMKDKGKSIYFVVYKFDHGNIGVNSYRVEGFSTENPQDVSIIEFDSLENEEDALKDVLGCVMQLYTSYNKEIESGDYPTEDELNQKCQKVQKGLYEKIKQEKDKLDNKFMAVREIYNRLFDYRSLLKKGIRIPNIEGLKIDVLQNGMSVAFMAGAREAVRVSFCDEDFKRDINGKIDFYLEYLSNSGKWKNTGKRHVCCFYYIPNITDINDEEARKIEVLKNRIIDKLLPIIREGENVQAKTNQFGDKTSITRKRKRNICYNKNGK